jgi:hypothetical protein
MADVESVDCEKMRDDGFLVSKVSFDSRRGPLHRSPNLKSVRARIKVVAAMC